MNCPFCNHPLKDHRKLFMTCNNPDCIMVDSPLDEKQWKAIADLKPLPENGHEWTADEILKREG